MILENLRRIQNSHGYLPSAELIALASRTNAPLHTLHEVASFFPHFRLRPPPAVTVKVCRDLACRLRGSATLQARLNDAARLWADESRVQVEEVSCLGRCDGAPAVFVELNEPGQHEICRSLCEPHPVVMLDRVAAIARAHLNQSPLDPEPPPDTSPLPGWIDPYHGNDQLGIAPYSAVMKFAQRLIEDPSRADGNAAGDWLLDALKQSELRGMGGAGKPAVLKWAEARRVSSDQKYIVCNADESEPATFKDRELLLRAPYLIIEGMALAALLIGADRGYVYIRHEYYDQIRVMNEAIVAARQSRVVGPDVLGTGKPFELEVFVSPGGYVCGEQGALMEAIEERRAEPRNRPPEPETNGLFDKPTILNNVETFAWVPAILLRGGDWYAGAGHKGGSWYEQRNKAGAKGLRYFSICGDVERPGVFEVPIGLPLVELIERAGGMRDRLPLKAIATSGPSGGFVPARITRHDVPRDFHRAFPSGQDAISLVELPLDLDEFRNLGLMLGAGLVVYADHPTTSMLDQALCATRFFRNESCGKCVPCRVGSQKLLEICESLARGEIKGDALDPTKRLVDELHKVMELTSICGLGTSAAKPLATVLHSFWKDLGRSEPIS